MTHFYTYKIGGTSFSMLDQCGNSVGTRYFSCVICRLSIRYIISSCRSVGLAASSIPYFMLCANYSYTFCLNVSYLL